MEQYQEMQVVLRKCKSYTDGKYKFRQNVPVTMPTHIAKKYAMNAMFSVRTVPKVDVEKLTSTKPKPNPGDPFKAPVSEADAALPQRKVKKKKVAAKKKIKAAKTDGGE